MKMDHEIDLGHPNYEIILFIYRFVYKRTLHIERITQIHAVIMIGGNSIAEFVEHIRKMGTIIIGWHILDVHEFI